jgi:hypothetical protein
MDSSGRQEIAPLQYVEQILIAEPASTSAGATAPMNIRSGVKQAGTTSDHGQTFRRDGNAIAAYAKSSMQM